MKQERSGSKLGGLGEGCEEPELQTEELGPDSGLREAMEDLAGVVCIW